MSTQRAEEQVAQLRARGQAQRLATQLALLEAREQLAPLGSALGVVRAVGRVFSKQAPTGGALGAVARFGIARPALLMAIGGFAWRLLRRHPFGVALAAALGATAWWLLRPAQAPRDDAPSDRQ